MTTYYDILEVGPRASASEIKAAHRRLVKKFHPDRAPGANTVFRHSLEDRFRDIQEAYDTLKDKAKRAEYDEMLAMLNSGEYYEPTPPPPPPPPPAQKAQYCPSCRKAVPTSAPAPYSFCVFCGASLQTPPRPPGEPARRPSPHRTNPNVGSINWIRQSPAIPLVFCLYVFVAFAEILGHRSETDSKPKFQRLWTVFY